MQSSSLRHPIRTAAAAASLVLVLSWPGIALAAVWQLNALPGLEKGYALNNQGLVAGQTSQRATSWRNGSATPLAEVAAGASLPSVANAVSPQGLMAGNGGNRRGAIWTGDGITSLGVLRQGVSTGALGVNDSGISVGRTTYGNGYSQATQWNPAGQPTLLPGLSFSQSSVALAINSAGQVVGLDTGDPFVDSYYRAVIWNQGVVSPLATPGWDASIANDINEHGEVAGWAEVINGAQRAVVWNADGSMRTLALPAGSQSSAAARLNDAGWVLGEASYKSGDDWVSELILWDEQDNASNLSQILTDLNAAAGTHWGHWSAGDLNDLGQIVVNGYDGISGRSQAFILSQAANGTSPVPEPHSLALALCGLVALVCRCRGLNRQ